jgi:hypothetical protein
MAEWRMVRAATVAVSKRREEKREEEHGILESFSL